MTKLNNSFGARTAFDTGHGQADLYRLDHLEKSGIASVARLPFSMKIMLEAALRQCDGLRDHRNDVLKRLANWERQGVGSIELPFKPARVILQDFTGVPCLVDLAAMRSRHGARSAATRRRSTRWCRSTWSSTTRCRWTTSARRRR